MTPRPQPYDLRIPSASDPAHEYHLTRAHSGSISHPGCRAHAFGRWCRHLARAEALTERPLATLVGDLEELAGLAARRLAELRMEGREGLDAERELVGFSSLLAAQVDQARHAHTAREEWLSRERVRAGRTDADRKVEAIAAFARHGGGM